MTTSKGIRSARVAGIAALVLASVTIAQEPPAPRPGSPRDQVVRRFMESAPDIGEPMPDVVVYDADGNARKLREVLQGRYSVLVLGCLT